MKHTYGHEFQKGGSKPRRTHWLPEVIWHWLQNLTRKIALSEINNELPGLDLLLQHIQKLRKLWHETRDPACKAAVNWVIKTTRRMTRRKALERWETKISNCEVTSHALWPTAKSLIKRDGPRAPTTIHDNSGLKFLPLENSTRLLTFSKINSHHMTCVTNTMNGGWRLESKLCFKSRRTASLKESVLLTYKIK